QQRNRSADSRIAAGDKRNFAFQLSSSLVDSPLVTGTRLHLRFDPRPLLLLLRKWHLGLLQRPLLFTARRKFTNVAVRSFFRILLFSARTSAPGRHRLLHFGFTIVGMLTPYRDDCCR